MQISKISNRVKAQHAAGFESRYRQTAKQQMMSVSRHTFREIVSLMFCIPCLIALSLVLTACGKSLPNPVESKDGQSFIPIADTAFLIPEKTWLTGYGRKSTDGMVAHIGLHAFVPDVLPWSQERHSLMYPKLGRGQIVEVDVEDLSDPNSLFFERFPNFPQSTWGVGKLVEEPSDLAPYGLRKFRQRWTSDGQIQAGTVFYEHVIDGKVKYLALCDDYADGRTTNQCQLFFPYAEKLRVTLRFRRDYMADGVRIADKIFEKLKEFEAAGRARLAVKNVK